MEGQDGGDGPSNLWAGDGPHESHPAGEPHVAGAATPTKLCPSCSVVEQTQGTFCAHCGTPYERDARKRRRPSRRVSLVVLALLVILAGGGTAAAMVVQHNNDQKAQRARQAAAHRRAEERHARELAQAAADRAAEAARREAAARDEATRSIRRSLVSDLRKSITKDARGRVADGYLDGPIYGTQCDPVGGGNASNLDSRTGRYSCLAYNKRNDDGTIEGYGFSATVNFEKFTYQWHLGNT